MQDYTIFTGIFWIKKRCSTFSFGSCEFHRKTFRLRKKWLENLITFIFAFWNSVFLEINNPGEKLQKIREIKFGKIKIRKKFLRGGRIIRIIFCCHVAQLFHYSMETVFLFCSSFFWNTWFFFGFFKMNTKLIIIFSNNFFYYASKPIKKSKLVFMFIHFHK